MTSGRFARSTLVSAYLAPIVLGIQATSFASRGMPWRGSALQTIETAANFVPLVLAVVAGAAAFDSARVSVTLASPVQVARKGRRGYWWIVLWAAGSAIVGHVVATIIALIAGGVSGTSVAPTNLMAGVSVQLLAIVWAASAGSAVGRFISPVVAGVAGIVVGYLPRFLTRLSGFDFVDFGGVTGTTSGYRYSWRYLALQGLVLAAMTLLFLSAPARQPKTVASRLAYGGGILALILVIVGVPGTPTWQRLVVNSQTANTCAGHKPTICLFAEQEPQRSVITARVKQLYAVAERNGYQSLMHARISAVSAGSFPADAIEVPDLDAPTKAWIGALVTPYHCPQIRSARPPEQSYFVDLDGVVRSWLALVDNTSPALTSAQVASVLASFDRCSIKVEA